MQYAQGSILTTLHAVQGFLAKNADRLGGVPTSGARKKIDEITASIDANGREQEDRAMAARMATVKRVAVRRALIAEHMQPIASVAAAELKDYSELTALHMPRLNINDQALIQKARSMGSAATAHDPTFTLGLVSPSYAADLESAAENLTNAMNDRINAVSSRQSATAGLATDTRTARKRLRVIDRLVMAVIKNDSKLVAEWSAAKQIAKKAGSPRVVVTPGDVAPATPTTPPTPATTTEAA